jgi:hypothetical protein
MDRHAMQKLTLILFFLLGFCGPSAAYCANTNQPPSSLAGTNTVPSYSDAEMQQAAQQVWRKLIVFGVLALAGGVVVAGFAFYGAYRKFGVPGMIVVGVIVALGVLALSSLLLLF